MVDFAKFMNKVYFTNFFKKSIFWDFIGKLRFYCQEQLFIFCQKLIPRPQKPLLPYWASKSAKKQQKKNFWTKTGNLHQCAMVKSL